MAEVFLSCSTARRALAESLAQDLESEGFSVWWDTSLLPINFRDEIDRQLDEAKAVVIIWTPEAVGSRWVRAGADHAHRDGKLINTHAGDLDPGRIPKPFNQTSSAELTDRAAVVAAVKRLAGRSLFTHLAALPTKTPAL